MNPLHIAIGVIAAVALLLSTDKKSDDTAKKSVDTDEKKGDNETVKESEENE